MKVIDVLKNELKCMKRQNGGICDNKRDCQSCDLAMDDKDIVFAYEKAISALENQIPKKIKAEHIKTSEQLIRLRHCPSCNVRFVRFGMNYCSDCGQALDWSD